MKEVIRLSCAPFTAALKSVPEDVARRVREIRIRVGQPVELVADETLALLAAGKPLVPSAEQLEALLYAFCEHSPYAHEEEIAAGFLSLPGGHRVGLTGHAVLRGGQAARLSDVQGMNIRIAHQAPIDAMLLPKLMDGNRLCNTLVVSPPGLGKTTLLRGLCRQLSMAGRQVALVDERGELAAMVQGKAQLDVGPRTDVLEGCPKAIAIPLLIRAMAPDVIITDELGGTGDAQALQEAARCGVSVLASAHGTDVRDVKGRPALKGLETGFAFERYVVLGGKPGRVLGVYDKEGRPWARG